MNEDWNDMFDRNGAGDPPADLNNAVQEAAQAAETQAQDAADTFVSETSETAQAFADEAQQTAETFASESMDAVQAASDEARRTAESVSADPFGDVSVPEAAPIPEAQPIPEAPAFTPAPEFTGVPEQPVPTYTDAPQQPNVPPQQPVNPQYPYGAPQNGAPYTAQNKNPYSASGYPYGGNAGAPAPQAPVHRNPYAYGDNQPPQKKKKGGKVVVAILAVILFVVLALVVKGVVDKSRSNTPSGPSATVPSADPVENLDEATTAMSPVSTDKTKTADDVLSPTEIYKRILPSSVGLLVYSNSSKTLASEGSGVIWAEDNEGKYTYILTCAHVIKGAGQNIVVQLFTEKEYPAQIVGYDSRTDIGVVRIEASGLTAIEIGDSSSLQVGDTIYAIGNPGGTEFANTFTNGIVTALDRPVASSSSGYTMECIQHNAAINPGNSGGALVNEYGQLIGINSMKIVDDEYEGMGFAVPSSVFVKVINDIIANGYVANRPKIGISYLRASTEQAYAMFVAIKGLPSGSIIIAEVSEDSDFYGKLQKGDLVTSINGVELATSTDLAAMIEDMKVGDTITMHVVRIHNDYSFDEVTVTGVLVEDKEDPSAEEEESTTSNYFDDYFGDYFDDYFGGGSGDDGSDFFGGFGNP